jgi:2-polyprenyl-3-methyl-5-hydroxy-6-metoxy-1,4-benzoquinol methylase
MTLTDERQKIFKDFEVPDPPRIKKIVNFIHKHFKNLKGLNVLECGAAKGGLADILFKQGAACFAIDINPRYLPGVKVIQSDLNQGLPNFECQFDIIFAGELIEHLYDDVAFVKSCNSILRPGGLFIATVPNLVFSFNRLRMLFGKMPMFAYNPCHYHIYTKKTIEKLLKDAGFSIIKFSSSHVAFSTRRHRIGRIFELIADFLPTFGAHLIVYATKGDKL